MDLFKVLLLISGILLVYLFSRKKQEKLDNTEPVVPTPTPVPSPLHTLEADHASPILQMSKENTHVTKEIQPLKTEDLLPQYDDANDFAKQNPVSKLLKEQNFLISGYHMGVNTVMQSNKIPYHDIRSVPPIPKESVGPFMNSSYETPMGSGRRLLEPM